MSRHPQTETTLRRSPVGRHGEAMEPTSGTRRFSDDIEGAFSPNLMRDQFEHLFRQFGR
jgi:hypothetical protein